MTVAITSLAARPVGERVAHPFKLADGCDALLVDHGH